MPADSASKASDFVRSRLAGSRFGDVRWVPETGSTNSDVLAWARGGAAEGVVLVADHQSQGRGRRGRSWAAPPGASLLVSVLLRPPVSVAGTAGMAVGLALAEAVGDVTSCDPVLKWPNDLVVVADDGDRKLAGILAEADWPAGVSDSGGWRAPAAHERATVVVGAGLNANWPDTLPEDLADTAVGLNQVVGHEVDRAELLVAFLLRLDVVYATMVRERSSTGVIEAWRQRSATLGRRVRVDLGAEDVEGIARDVTQDGYLVVETDDGNRRTFAAGDVVHLRPI